MHVPRYGLFFMCIIPGCFHNAEQNNSYVDHFLAFRGHKQAPFKCNN